MRTVKSIRHWRTAVEPDDGPRTTVESGVKRYLPIAGSISEIVNVLPAHAVLALPVATSGSGTTTPGS